MLPLKTDGLVPAPDFPVEGKPPVSAERQAVMKERITVMARLKPEAFITGSDGFLRYFGAKFGDDFVAFENVNYGNALYIMYEGGSS